MCACKSEIRRGLFRDGQIHCVRVRVNEMRRKEWVRYSTYVRELSRNKEKTGGDFANKGAIKTAI